MVAINKEDIMTRIVRQTKIRQWTEERDKKKERLDLYYEMERKMLTGSPQAYSLGTRSKTNYPMTPDQLRSAIEKLEKEIEELEGLITGQGSRRVVSIIPRN